MKDKDHSNQPVVKVHNVMPILTALETMSSAIMQTY
jgi:hypothetical protein